MKQLFSLKFKMHKLVNMIFYLIIFAIGFIVGLTLENVNAAQLASDVTSSQLNSSLSYGSGYDDYDYSKNLFNYVVEYLNLDYEFNDYNHVLTSKLPGTSNTYYYFYSKNDYILDSDTINATDDYLSLIYYASSKTWTINYSEVNSSEQLFSLTDSSQLFVLNQENYSDFGSNFSFFEMISYEFDSSLFTRPTISNFHEEENIYNIFNEINDATGLNLNFLDFNNVYLEAYSSSAWINKHFSYTFSSGDYSNSTNQLLYTNGSKYIHLVLNYSSNTFKLYYIHPTELPKILSSGSITSIKASNVDVGTRSLTYSLDFSSYSTPNYHLNDGSIFEDSEHQDFQKVCWENFDKLTFSVTIDSSYDGSYDVYEEGQQDGETYVKSGFYVFDDITNLRRGTRKYVVGAFDYEYNASTWLSGLQFEQLFDIEDSFIFLKNEDLIGARYSDIVDALGNYDLSRGDSYYYDNLNKLLNSNYVSFTYYYNVVGGYYYDIFELNEKKEKFCIYIPNSFIVTTLEVNELGGMIGDVPLHDDKNETFLDNTEFSKGLDTSQLFSLLRQFLSSIREVINYINEFVYAFFLSMPLTVQMFIYSCLTLCIVFIIIRMVIK